MIKIYCYCSGSSGNLYLVQNEKTKFLLECGVNDVTIRKFLKQQGVRINTLNACLVSHKHNDHSLGIHYVNKYCDVYGTQQMFTDKRLCGGNVVEKNKNFTIGTIRIKPIPVNHGNCDNFAYIFKDDDSCIFWGTDFSLLAEKDSNSITNLHKFKFTEVWIECNYITEYLEMELSKAKEKENFSLERKLTRQLNTHLSLKNCIRHLETFDLSMCKNIRLIHISQGVGHPILMENEVEKTFGIPTKATQTWEDM